MRREQSLFVGTAVPTVAGLVTVWAGNPTGSAGTVSDRLWSAATGAGVAEWLWIAAALLGLGWSTVTLGAAVRRREPSVDVIAWLALAGALWVGEPFAGAVIAVMLAGGALLEGRAQARARRELGLLAERMPRIARRDSGAGPVMVAVDEVAVGDRLVVGAGEVVPVDGRLSGAAVLDESALTGEPMPVERRAGEEVRSGVVNAGPAMRLTAIATARDSTYAGVVRLVEQARAGSAPFVRMADRWAVAFVPLTLLLAGVAWAASGDPVRAVAVLVVATPCPLLLAAPIAIMSGISRAARSGVVVKGGGALERLAAGRVLLIDKTGTLTEGRPRLVDVVVAPGGALAADEVLRLAASVEQSSAHVLAGAIVSAAHGRGLRPGAADQVRERHGYGIEGVVDGRRVRLGRAAAPADDESLTVAVTVDGVPAGVLRLEDPLRPQGPRMIRALRAAGIRRVVLVTGDQGDGAANRFNARHVKTPQQKTRH
ncbi:HAD-IC family P-type ATPase [Actinoplanes philippinensis]|uniref:HAD-IC family P-type ATPase n=1 Tax=Actinoplanes philippinensis TaxID=35752 RepID=UPI0033E5B1A3